MEPLLPDIDPRGPPTIPEWWTGEDEEEYDD